MRGNRRRLRRARERKSWSERSATTRRM